jgi:polysaccharide biosynthesis protein PslH
MRLLVVMPSYPFSPRAGIAIVAYNNIKELSKKHSIYFICFDVAEELKDFAEFTEHTEFVRPKFIPVFIQLVCYVFYALLRIPFLPATCMSHDMRRRVKELMKREKFDAILLYNLMAIQYCPPSSYKKVIVNVEDPQSIKTDRMNRLPLWSLWQKAALFVRARLAAQFEKRYLPKIAKVLMLSEADMRDLQEQGGYDNIGCVSYGVDKRSIEEIVGYEERTEGMIIFSGSMFHPPNIDGALFFLQRIFSLVLQEYSTAILWIVGAEPDMRIRDAAACFGEHVVITGRVKDMSEYLRRAKVSICPVRLKIGVQTKILEALSWGTPVVTTSAGNSGIEGCSGRELWVEDEPNIFASRVVALLRGEGWHRLSEEGRKLVEERFSWERSAKELEEHIMRIQTVGGGW